MSTDYRALCADYRALCAELAQVLAEEYGVQRDFDSGEPLLGSGVIELLSCARAALAQPEPQGVTEHDIAELAWRHTCEIGDLGVGIAVKDAPAFIRAALARWGHPAIEPVPVSERLPGPEDCLGRPFEETDAGFCWWFDPGLNAWRFMMALCWVGGAYQKRTPPGTTHWLPHHALPIPTP